MAPKRAVFKRRGMKNSPCPCKGSAEAGAAGTPLYMAGPRAGVQVSEQVGPESRLTFTRVWVPGVPGLLGSDLRGPVAAPLHKCAWQGGKWFWSSPPREPGSPSVHVNSPTAARKEQSEFSRDWAQEGGAVTQAAVGCPSFTFQPGAKEGGSRALPSRDAVRPREESHASVPTHIQDSLCTAKQRLAPVSHRPRGL